jgi:hypothetical protein
MLFVAGKIGLRGSAEMIPEKSHGAASSKRQKDETAPLSNKTRHAQNTSTKFSAAGRPKNQTQNLSKCYCESNLLLQSDTTCQISADCC